LGLELISHAVLALLFFGCPGYVDRSSLQPQYIRFIHLSPYWTVILQ